MSASESAVQTPSLIRDPVLFRFPSSSPPLQASAGRLFGGGRFAWLLNRSGGLRIFKSESGECVALLRLVPRGSRVSVLCSCELRPEKDSPPNSRTLLVLATHLEGHEGKTAVVVINPAASKLIRAVEIPWGVTSLCGVASECVQVAGLFAQSLLQNFAGILAVGCSGGRMLLVDLALGTESSHHSSVKQPQALVFIESLRSGSLATITEARETGRHACVDISAAYHQKGKFLYRPRNDATIREFPVDSLAITSLHFVPQMLTLLIGYSFGGFQLFNIPKMSVVHSSPCPKAPSPVTHFTYQEPENDPKHNVYLWVARGNPPFVGLNVETKLTLYQVLFARKVGNSSGTIYENFQSCGPVFIYALTPTPIHPNPSQSHTSNLISCRTVEMKRVGRGLDESHDDNVHSPDLTVAMFVWQCGDSAHRDYVVGVFDLNQYYHSQVPKMLQWRSSGRHSGVLGCSYFTFYSLNSFSEGKTLLDAAVTDCSPFFSLPPVPETHLWPTSLSFNVTAISSDGFLKCTCLGLQRTALEDLRVEGVAVFSRPQGVFSLCERADLLGPAWDLDHSSVEVQQKALLSVALEHQMTSVLSACAHTWMDRRSETSFPLFVDWVRQKLEDTMNEMDRLCYQLFSGSADAVDKSSSLLLRHLRSMFYHLSRLLTSLLTPLTSSQDPHLHQDPLVTELSGFYVTSTTCYTITQVVIWCVRNGLLPVATDNCGRYFVYPATALNRLCDRLRSENSPCRLSVDYLCEDVQSDYHYPPNSLEDLLAIFTTTDSLAQHCLMVYFLCDVSNLDGFSFDQDTLLESYSVQFNLPKALTALAKGLWALDHSQYQVALSNLIGRQLYASQWLPWQHSAVLSLLLRAPDPRLALQYIDVYKDFLSGPEHLKLRLNAYVRHQCVSDAVELLRPYEDSEEIEELFIHFLDLCFQYKCLSKLVNIPLNEFEDAFFCTYLEDSPSLKAQELLVMHYLTHHRYGDAITTQDRIRPLAMADPDPRVRERSEFRDTLLEGFSRCVPSVLRELDRLSGEKSTPFKHKPVTKVTNPPLSSVLAKSATTKMKSRAGEIFEAMTQIAEARDVPAEPLTPLRKSDRDAPHTPFFSPPLSVRKAMSSRRKCPVVRATPVAKPFTSAHVSTPDQHTSGTTSGLSFLSTHMQNFKKRMFQLSQTAGTIDASLIRTPASKPMESTFHTCTTLPPPSILKVKQPSDGVRSEGGEEEMEEGEGEGEAKSTPATVTRKIRFAVEGTPLVSPTPTQSHLTTRSTPIPYTAGHPSPVTTTISSSIALEMPLSSSDDSDLFYSFTESPHITSPTSQLTPAHLPQGPPSQPPFPKEQLFVGADEDYEDDQQQDSKQQQQQDGKQDEPDSQAEVVAQTGIQSDCLQQSHDQETVMPFERKTAVSDDVSVAKATTPQKIRFQDTRSLLIRERIGYRPSPSPQQTGMESGYKTTPTSTGIAGSGSGLFAPNRPSPLSYSITTKSSPQISSRNPSNASSTHSATRKSIFSLEVASELVDAKKDRLSLESERKRTVDRISSPPHAVKKDTEGLSRAAPCKTVRIPLSSTMVQLPSPNEQPKPEGQGSDAGGYGEYRFSPGKIISTPPMEHLEASGAAFMFSPPYTRSTARKKAAVSRTAIESEKAGDRDKGSSTTTLAPETRETGLAKKAAAAAKNRRAAVEEVDAPSDTPDASTQTPSVSSSQSEGDEQTTTTIMKAKKTVRSRGTRAVSAQPLEHIHLVSPPSRQATPTTGSTHGQRSRQQTTRSLHNATRRSTRLLQDKRK